MNKYLEYKDTGFEWVGPIPVQWALQRVMQIFSERQQKVDDKTFPPLSVTMNGVVDQLPGVAKTHHSDNRKLVKKGDFVINSRSDRKGSSGISPRDGSVSVINIVMEPRKSNSSFYEHLFKSFYFREEFFRNGKGIVWDLWSTKWDQLKVIQVPVPPQNDQALISNYLNKKTSQIDSLIEKIKQKIELLKEQRASLISQCVTKGLNPDVEMKDSRVKWIGKIPVVWEVKKIKHGFYVKGRIGWKGLKSSEFLSEGFSCLVTGTDFKGGKVDWKGCYHIDKDRYEEDPYIQLHENDLLITKDGSIGKLAIVEELDKPACLNSGIFVVRSISGDFTTRYLYWVLTSNIFAQFNGYMSYGSTIQHLYQNVFLEFSFGFPTLEEQILISNYLDKQSSQIDFLVEKETKRVELLKEYRQSLISNVVTGKVRIREEMI